MDLQSFVPTSDTITIILKNPVTDEALMKDDGVEMSITVYAPHSKEYKAAVHAQANKRIQKIAKTKKNTFTSEEIETSTVEVLAQTTKDWDIQLNKKSPKFTVETALDLYQKLPWLKAQVSEGQEEFVTFLTK